MISDSSKASDQALSTPSEPNSTQVGTPLAEEGSLDDVRAPFRPDLQRAEVGLRRSMTALTVFVLWLLISVVGPFAHAQGAVDLPTGLALLSLYSVFTAATFLGLAWRVWTILRTSGGRRSVWLPWLLAVATPVGISIGLVSSQTPIAICFGLAIAMASLVATDAVLQLVCRNRLVARIEAAKEKARALRQSLAGAKRRSSKPSRRPSAAH